jgi:tetratricopeptide (TPR) repeat protein
LPAIALLVALPTALDGQLGFTTVGSTTENSASTHSFASNDAEAALRSQAPVVNPELKADVLLAREEYRAAVKSYAKVEQPSADVWNKMGIAYQMLFDFNDAARCYKESLRLEPDNTRALNNLATVDDSLRDFAAAERLYKKDLRLYPRTAQVLKNLGTNLLMQHQYGRGADAYRQALAIDPHIFDTQLGPSIDAPAPVQERGAENYFQARSCASAGLTDCALAHLRAAFNEGAATLKRVANEDDFDGLREKAEFQGLLAEQK